MDAILDEYISKNYANKVTATIVVRRPVPNSREVATVKDGKLDNGHTFLRLDDGNNNIKYFGFSQQDNHFMEMVLGLDVAGCFVDDKMSDWNVAKVFVISQAQYDGVLEYKNNYNMSYNIEDNNCTTFAVNALKDKDIQIKTYESQWLLPYNIDELINDYKAKPTKMPSFVVKCAIIDLMGDNFGYTPSNVAQDLKEMQGGILLNYDNNLKIKNVPKTNKEKRTEPTG